MPKNEAELLIEITKSPRGMLTFGAQISGNLKITVFDIKSKIDNISLELLECWNSESFTLKPNEKKFSATHPMPQVIGEPHMNWIERINEARKFGEYTHYIVHERLFMLGDVKKKDKLALKPNEEQKLPFLLTLPAKWSCDNPTGNWRFEILAFLSDKTCSNILIVPVEGSKVKPSWYFEPIKIGTELGENTGSTTNATYSQTQLGYVGSFTVVPKGQKATLLLGKGEAEEEYRISLQTPGTVRSGSEYRQTVDPAVFEGLMGKLEKVTSALNVLRSLPATDPARAKVEKAHEVLKKFGYALFLQMIPEHLHDVIKNLKIALDFGLDESLVGYPWELLHDGTNFLCLKIPLGRYVATSNEDHSFKFIERGKRNGVRILLIVDPDDSLPGARSEGEAIKNSLETIAGVDLKVLAGADATKAELLMELAGGYDFLHYSGHAEFNSENPANSGLLLADGMMKASTLVNAVKGIPPILAFINACEAGRQTDWSKGETQFENQVSGLASSFLLNGINFIGPYWPVYDDAALTFSVNFYQAVLSGVPLGESVRRAKEFIYNKYKGEEIAWASYSFYGDPTQTLEFEKE
ncbi:MAG TPA: CHAT domain-containing protein [Candidatus Lokiarchaeia archaeon]|nr:CHAT domain-containing protein [Candidatus Lokiarchaeia archaeon]